MTDLSRDLLPDAELITQLEDRQDAVLRDLDDLIIRLESVLAQYAPSKPTNPLPPPAQKAA